MKRISHFCRDQAISKTVEKHVIVQVYELDEPVCKPEKEDREEKFRFVYTTFSNGGFLPTPPKLSLVLPKRILISPLHS